jgi:hypothetical protein
MLSMLLYPAFSVCLLAVLVVYWILVTVYMASTGSDVTSSTIYASAAVCD